MITPLCELRISFYILKKLNPEKVISQNEIRDITFKILYLYVLLTKNRRVIFVLIYYCYCYRSLAVMMTLRSLSLLGALRLICTLRLKSMERMLNHYGNISSINIDGSVDE